MSQFFKLSTTGAKIPSIGYGTGTAWYKSSDAPFDQTLVDTLVTAVSVGFTHIDGAEVYNSALEIGEALKKSGAKRENLWLTDKYYAGDGSYSRRSPEGTPLQSLKASLKKFDTPYVDLYLLHAPFIKKETHGFSLEEAWGYLEEAQKLGLAKNIGVSNFTVTDLEKVLAVAKVKPQVHQIEYNAYLQDQTPGVVEFSQKHDILVEAYSPLSPITKGKPGPLDGVLAELASKYGKSEGQILLRWVLQKGVLPITTSSKESRLKEYLDVYSFELTAAEVAQIAELGKQKQVRQFWTAEFGKY